MLKQELTTSKRVGELKQQKKKDRRSGKGRCIAYPVEYTV